MFVVVVVLVVVAFLCAHERKSTNSIVGLSLLWHKKKEELVLRQKTFLPVLHILSTDLANEMIGMQL